MDNQIIGIRDGRNNVYLANRYDLSTSDTKGFVVEQAYGEFAQDLFDYVSDQTGTTPHPEGVVPGYTSYEFNYHNIHPWGTASATTVKDRDDGIRHYIFSDRNETILERVYEDRSSDVFTPPTGVFYET